MYYVMLFLGSSKNTVGSPEKLSYGSSRGEPKYVIAVGSALALMSDLAPMNSSYKHSILSP